MIRESMYDKEKTLNKNQSSKVSRKGSTLSKNSVSKVEYRHFKKHEFFEERVKKQREKVRFMIEEDPESDRKVNFKNNQGFIKVDLISSQWKLQNYPKSTSRSHFGKRMILSIRLRLIISF
jgi:hypothetical protein